MKKVHVFWFRRDLRLEDNRGLWEALRGDYPVLPVFIFDPNILDELPGADARVQFIWERLGKLKKILEDQHQSTLQVIHAHPKAAFEQLFGAWDIQGVYTNEDYEPYARERDQEMGKWLAEKDIPFYCFKDQVIFAKDEVVKDDGDPYVVYTPYMRKWKARFREKTPQMHYASETLLGNLANAVPAPTPALEDMGFQPTDIRVPDFNLGKTLVRDYEDTRNFPARDGTSHLGPHLRFGTVSVRQAVGEALKPENETFWEELIWREFFMQILWHFPRTVHEAFKKPYDNIRWRNNTEEFEAWKAGKTGYLLVDAGMRQLNQTGYMHNRVRMLVASFLCKHLLIDWRWGEAYFAEKLLDYEMASNVGNWQWAAGSGVDAAPYFRIFNPMTQVDKFDKGHRYIEQWVPEAGTDRYPEKIVDHKAARERCLETYKAALD
ncbi:deoxyribodipyrimidine photo-lyase [Robiginitalea sp. M366]|uniref:cryptochrome/photolyase family protein n=1 Tax=Robiginitalea aestuariiviva TaxID=3036903 RepID=UPI00240E8154|nr:deoxyribodipyrimidine photo-lyase [Robiginitalea aestuariiviva]MDG1572782.1 deoxyribodipyrimidine photo-lyase [Robiginitalea aestuariiviva]